MKRTGVIVAMNKELRLLLPLFEDARTEFHDGMTFHVGKISGREVIAMECGIGKVNAAIGTQTLIERYKPEIVINTGVAGGTGAAGVLDLIAASAVGYHDVWCGPGTVPGEAAGCPLLFTTALNED